MSQINIGNLRSVINKHSPEILIGMGLAGMVMQARLSAMQCVSEEAYLKAMYEFTGHKIYLYKYLQATKSNNWLRMHGYPMRKRIRH